MKKYTIPVFIFLAIIALSSKASNAKDTGAFAVQEILKHCFSGKKTFNAVAGSFQKSGWKAASGGDRKIIKKLIDIGKSFAQGQHKMKVYSRAIASQRVIAIVSKVSNLPTIGCYIYAPNTGYEQAEKRVNAIMRTDPTRRVALNGDYRLLQWHNTAHLRPNISLKLMYTYKGGRMEGLIGFQGISVATSILTN